MLSSHGNVSLPWNCFTVCKKKLGCKGNSSHEMFITLLRFFAPYFLLQFSHSLVYLRSIDKEEKAAQFWHGKIQGVWVEVILAFSITYFCTNTGYLELYFFWQGGSKIPDCQTPQFFRFLRHILYPYFHCLARAWIRFARKVSIWNSAKILFWMLVGFLLFYALLASLTNNQMEIH